MQLSTTVSLVLGVWGAGLSTVLLVRQVRSDRRSVLVRARIGHRTGPDGARHRVLALWITNQGKRPVEIRSVALELINGRFAVFEAIEGDSLPVRLSDGEGMTLHFQLGQFKRALQNQPAKYIIATDATGATYTCPVPDEVNDALETPSWHL
jgi:hypothetical protein